MAIIYNIPAGTKVTTLNLDGSVIHRDTRTLKDQMFEYPQDFVKFEGTGTVWRHWFGYHVKVSGTDIRKLTDKQMDDLGGITK